MYTHRSKTTPDVVATPNPHEKWQPHAVHSIAPLPSTIEPPVQTPVLYPFGWHSKTPARPHDAMQVRKGLSAKGVCQNRTGQGKTQVHGALYTLVLCACSFARTCSALSSQQSGVMSCLDERVTASLGTNTSARKAVSCSLSVMLSPFNRLSVRSLIPNRTDSAIKVSLGLNGTREHPTGSGKAGKGARLLLDGWLRGGTGTFSAEDASCSSNGNGSAKKGSMPASAG
jgi:hypothetical protein